MSIVGGAEGRSAEGGREGREDVWYRGGWNGDGRVGEDQELANREPVRNGNMYVAASALQGYSTGREG